MPYTCESINLVDLQDRRKKLTDQQRSQIKETREKTGASYSSLAKQFGVSRVVISVICDNKIRERRREYNKKHWRDYRKSKEEVARVAREHRRYKQKLKIEGKLCEPYVLVSERKAIAMAFNRECGKDETANTMWLLSFLQSNGLLDKKQCKQFAKKIMEDN